MIGKDHAGADFRCCLGISGCIHVIRWIWIGGFLRSGDERYSYDANLYICEDDVKAVIESDRFGNTLRVTGIGKNDLHCCHNRTWELALTDTELFLRKFYPDWKQNICGSDQKI